MPEQVYILAGTCDTPEAPALVHQKPMHKNTRDDFEYAFLSTVLKWANYDVKRKHQYTYLFQCLDFIPNEIN